MTEDDELKKLRKEVRELKEINRYLHTRLKKFDKTAKGTKPSDFVEDKRETSTSKNKCPGCQEEGLIEVEIRNIWFQRCGAKSPCTYKHRIGKR